MRVVYIDVLFLINFIIDYLMLSLTSHLRGYTLRRLKLMIAAAIGGGIATVLFFLPNSFTLTLLTRVLCCALLTAISFGTHSVRRFAYDCVFLTAVSFIVSGAVIAVSQIIPGAGEVSNSSVYFDISLRTLFLGAAAAYLVVSSFFRFASFKHERRCRTLRCTLRGSELVFNAFEDTGNVASDPVSGKRIIVVSPSLIMPALSGDERRLVRAINHASVTDIFSSLAEHSAASYGIVPVKTSGGKGLMITVRPDRLEIDGAADEGYILGISAEEIEVSGGCRALIGC